ncbi:hypothetical protein J6590_033782 [Homalodisca vitripennis]|nr:hypothetical protein J6590_033782 [Homalodisca vitripennis]
MASCHQNGTDSRGLPERKVNQSPECCRYRPAHYRANTVLESARQPQVLALAFRFTDSFLTRVQRKFDRAASNVKSS